MNTMIRKLFCTLLLFTSVPFCTFLFAQSDWVSVPLPEILTVRILEDNCSTVRVTFNLETTAQTADKGRVVMLKDGIPIAEKPVGKTKSIEKKVDFIPAESGLYTFIVYAQKKNEQTDHASIPVSYEFSLPLEKPLIQIVNKGNGKIHISWNAVKEAQSYSIRIRDEELHEQIFSELQTTEKTIENLTAGKKYSVEVSAVRDGEESFGEPVWKTIREEPDREWNFTYFGQSVKKDYNTFTMLDADNLKFSMTSCSFDQNSGTIIEKGGKFTAFHDGVSFYYTAIEADTENFELSATFTIDYINPSADGQEGFGLLVMDSLGQYGVSSVNHYTNSAGIIATKFEETIGGTKYTSKDTLGARFVTGLTKDNIDSGDSGIASYGKSLSRAFSYDQSSLIKKGDVVRLTLKKDNTGYHTVYEKEFVHEQEVLSFTLYGSDTLLQLDSQHVYAGFVCARGCNITVSDVVMKITDPQTDPPPQKEPPRLLPLEIKVDSPSSYTEPLYPFVYCSNADGFLSLSKSNGETILERKVKAGVDVKEGIILKRGVNFFTAVFTPDKDFSPGENTVMARYDKELEKYVESYNQVTTSFTVTQMSFEGGDGKLYVSTNGSIFGKGTKDSPLDLVSAVQYVKPGQTIVLSGGTYTFSKGLVIERGNSGSILQRKKIQSAEGEKAVLDFSYAGGGFVLWGSWWIIENIDICNTDGNVKGLQIAGNHTIVRRVNAYSCGDTGIQISGTSTEPRQKWPAHNLIEGCVSYNNCDPSQNNADGFAAKLTCGNGNVFRHCIAYSNIDDGWDLFSKIETGAIGEVLIEFCASFNNGSLLDGSGNGDGNGFKLGGDGISVRHRIINSCSWNNGQAGITSNSNPSIEVDSCTVYGNKGVNLTIYGKGTVLPDYIVLNTVSMEGAGGDSLLQGDTALLQNTYLWNGAQSKNEEGKQITKDAFISTDTSLYPSISSKGTLDMKGLFIRR